MPLSMSSEQALSRKLFMESLCGGLVQYQETLLRYNDTNIDDVSSGLHIP